MSAVTGTAASADVPEPPEHGHPESGGAGRRRQTGESEVDAAVLARVARRDQHALGELYDRFGRQVYSLARRICRDEHIAEEATQELFLAVWRQAGRFDPARGSVRTWIFTLAHHIAVDAVRREAAIRRRTLSAGEDERELPAAPGADQAAIGSVVGANVRAALAALPPAQRQVLALAYYRGCTQSEIATTLGIPLGTVKSRTFAAMTSLRPALHGFEP
ncbi:sigma-70 family RNA polymerase sigma factor [Actinomycetospora sp. NBRC 106375]|uniref:sigma-70 family RNA polymerase sigma factor n=1 Tax=Actinomycetospora sp. NBRC 106375 TaxID=3032207 RepID=UPI002554EBC4|nr:sigma-70 family RNA polymerase sigma factor [Actinomycetospora sp. NBRC 106375]